MPTDAIRLVVWSDYLCPWCYVGTVRLDKLQIAEGEGVTLEWRSFLLRPFPEDRDVDDFVAYTRNWSRPAEMEPAAPFTVPWSGEHLPPSHSMPPAVAAKVVEGYFPAHFDAFHRSLLTAYFVDNRTVSDRGVLAEVARSVGIDRSAFEAIYDDQWEPLARTAYDQHNQAIGLGIGGVPAVVIDHRHLVTGAVDVAHYQAALDQVRAEQAS